MREKKEFGERQKHKDLPKNETLKEIFGVVNDGCDSKQVVDFIRKTTGKNIDDEENL